MDHAHEHNEVRAAPEVELVNGAGCKSEDCGEATDKRNRADRRDGFFSCKVEVVFAEADKRLDNRNRACDAREEEHREPNGLENAAKRERSENVRHRLESKSERTELCTFFDVCTCDKHCHRNHDRTADNHFGKTVCSASRERRKHEVFFRFQITCIAKDDGHAKAHREEYLACCRHPYFRACQLRNVRIPHKRKPFADAGKREHAYHEHEPQNQKNRHANFVRTFNALAHTERKHNHVCDKRYNEENYRDRDAADASFQHNVIAKELRHFFGALSDNVHQGSCRRVERKRQNP